MDDPSPDPHGEQPGPLPGAAVGVAGGLLVSAVWAYGAWDVALALTAVFAGLTIAVTLAAPGWRQFGLAMLVAAVAVGGLLVLVVV
ncbi:hypothetical protein [Nocardioides sp. CER19]|uniref:hypothetical protein n=1 Tax=Nocardioides sp. CER19 TaxID=3038538 RepID=UPI002447B040|nr:hypothetical protein [Nocardioides sp. CER19]MDH2416495.1 hypothetical protein [Nocardioides sp. CER19]